MGRAFIDYTSTRFNKLLVIEYAGKDSDTNRLWRCQCDCGTIKIIAQRRLTSGNTQSCGCFGRSRLNGGGLNKLESGVARLNELYNSYKKRAERKGITFALNINMFSTLTKANCYYCNKPPSQVLKASAGVNGDYIYNGVDRINSLLGYESTNVRTCCWQCNQAKGTLSESDFFAWLLRVRAYLAATQARFEFGETPR